MNCQRKPTFSRTRLLPTDHPHTLNTQRNLAEALVGCGRLDEARQLLAEVLETQTRVLPARQQHTMGTRLLHATVLVRLGHAAEAERELRTTVADQTTANFEAAFSVTLPR